MIATAERPALSARVLAAVRSLAIPIAVSFALFALGLPVYLRMPLCWDSTLYDVAARNWLAGGMLYRDVFDTNTPGFVWCMAGIRWILGESTVAVRAVDFAIFAGIVAILDRLAAWAGGSRVARWWAIAAMLSIYPFETEFVHVQRDIWLGLPMLAAVALRLRRILRTRAEPDGRVFWPAALEGVLWGLATWIKPHVLPMAAIVWLATAPRLSGGSWRRALRDLAGNFLAGFAVGLLGLIELVASGTWPQYWLVMTQWNVLYTDLVFDEFTGRIDHELHWVRPWSWFLVPSVPLVILAVFQGRLVFPRWRPASTEPPRAYQRLLFAAHIDDGQRYARAALALVYLAWVLDSYSLQRAFIYVHILELFLMLALWAGFRWWWCGAVVFYALFCGALARIGDSHPEVIAPTEAVLEPFDSNWPTLSTHYRHPLTKADYPRQWLAAWSTPIRGPDDARLKDDTKRLKGHLASSEWAELIEVADWLRTQNAGDGEVVCWNEGVHPLYMELGIRPGFRFLHVHNTESFSEASGKQMRAELQEKTALRFAVFDLEWLALMENWNRADLYPAGRSPDNPKPKTHPHWDGVFPYDRAPLFRSRGGRGRYIVVVAVPPLGKLD